MRMRMRAGMSAMVIAFLLLAGGITGQTTKTPTKSGKGPSKAAKAPLVMKAEALTMEESQALLAELNDVNKALPASYMFEVRHEKIDPQWCFGAKLANGKRLAGESTGKSYGIRGTKERADGVGGSYIVIGSFYSEFPFSIEGKALAAGAYIVHAYPDAIELAGDDPSETRYDNNRRREVPKAKTAVFRVKTPVAPELLAKDAKEAPRVVVSVEGGAIEMTVGENKWRVTPMAGQ